MERYGLSLISPQHAALYRFQQSYLGPHAPPVNMLRVTGRPEAQEQRPAPWGYGDVSDNEWAGQGRLCVLGGTCILCRFWVALYGVQGPGMGWWWSTWRAAWNPGDALRLEGPLN